MPSNTRYLFLGFLSSLSILLCLPAWAVATETGPSESASPSATTENEANDDDDETTTAETAGSVEEEIVVRGSRDTTSTDREYASAGIVDVLDRDDFAVTGDSVIADALRRIVGITVINGRYLYVRGLGERYSSTILNGVILPSPDPARRVVPVDLFPVGVLETADVHKTYHPSLPGEFSGATVHLQTIELPRNSFFNLSFSLSGNTETINNDIRSYTLSDSAWTGIDDGSRDLPSTINELTENGVRSSNDLSAAEQQSFATALNQTYDIFTMGAPPTFSANLSGGRQFTLGSGETVGVIGALRYSNDWQYKEEDRKTFGGSGVNDELRVENNTTLYFNENMISTAGLLGLDWQIDDSHRIRSTYLLSRRTQKNLIREFGLLAENDIEIADTTLEWAERQLWTLQVEGSHFFPRTADSELQWMLSYSKASRDKPDMRFYRYERIPGYNLYSFSDSGQSNERSWEALSDAALYMRASYTFIQGLTNNLRISWEAGLNYLDKERDSSYRRFRYQSNFSINNLRSSLNGSSPEVIFAQQNLGPGLWELRETTLPTDNYTATEDQIAAYLIADTDLGRDWRMFLGLRVEQHHVKVNTYALIDPAQQVTGELDETTLLPSMTLTWLMNDQMQFRVGYSRTLNRPDLKELSSARYIEQGTRYPVEGNPDLQQAAIDNFDIRWEWYFSGQDNLQIAAFHKRFESPIERVIILGAGGLRTYANANSAINTGVEFSLRKALGEPDSKLRNFFVSVNGALIDSEVDLGQSGAQQTNPKRPLQGQSDWVINTIIGYENIGRDILSSLSFNVAGERITDVGVQGLPDAYEQGVPLLEFFYSQKFSLWNRTFGLQIKASNLLDSKFEITRGNETERQYHIGRSISVGVNLKI